MESNELFVPLFIWLLGSSRIGGGYNTYYGSCTERPGEAAWGQRVFNYVVYIEKTDDSEILKASVYPGLLSFSNADPETVETKAFVCEEASLPALKAWLTERRDCYFRT